MEKVKNKLKNRIESRNKKDEILTELLEVISQDAYSESEKEEYVRVYTSPE